MNEMLIEFWSRLTSSVHPDDEAAFRAYGTDHGFNLDYPPPAYWGDIANAPILVLDNNGGFNTTETPAEFVAANAVSRHLERLRQPGPLSLEDAPPYYRRLNFSAWVSDGRAALINAVAYRSVDSKGANVKRLSIELPSAVLHRRWLNEVALPAALRGERLLIVHRWSLWRLRKGHPESPMVLWSPAPVSPHLTDLEIGTAEAWLKTR